MSQALYRKYRPQIFAELVNQEHIRTTLLNEIRTGQVAHAYIFSGPRGIGKTTVARLLAKAVNCAKAKNGEPCNECLNCRNITDGRALDIIEIDAASHTGVDNVRENIINNARVAPSSLLWKVFVIDEVHMLSLSSFNALLKTLEEPPAQTIFILATTEIHRVPETIISRCQRFDFHRLDKKAILKRLEEIAKKEKIRVDLEVLERIASRSQGYMRDAESLLGQILSLDEKHITKEVAELILPRSNLSSIVNFFELLGLRKAKEAMEMVNNLLEEGINLIEWSKEFLEFLRQLLVYKVTNRLVDLDYLSSQKDLQERVINRLTDLSIDDLAHLVELFLNKPQEIKNSDLPQLPLELAIVNWCGGAREIPIAKIAKGRPGVGAVEKIEKLWPAIIQECKKHNHSLFLTLNLATVVSFTNNILTLGLPYSFYCDRLLEPDNCAIIEKILTAKLGEKVKLACKASKEYAKKLATDDTEKLAQEIFNS